MLIHRRGFLAGLGALIAAPAIVRAASLMPVRAIVIPRHPLYDSDSWQAVREGFYKGTLPNSLRWRDYANVPSLTKLPYFEVLKSKPGTILLPHRKSSSISGVFSLRSWNEL